MTCPAWGPVLIFRCGPAKCNGGLPSPSQHLIDWLQVNTYSGAASGDWAAPVWLFPVALLGTSYTYGAIRHRGHFSEPIDRLAKRIRRSWHVALISMAINRNGNFWLNDALKAAVPRSFHPTISDRRCDGHCFFHVYGKSGNGPVYRLSKLPGEWALTP